MTGKLNRPHSPLNPTILRCAIAEDIEKTQLFRDTDQVWLDHIAKDSSICKLPANASLKCVRGEVNHLYVIIRGYVAIWRPSSFRPNEYSFLAWRGPGQPIGEMRVLGEPRLSTRIDTCDPCEFIEIREDTFSEVLNGSPIIYRNIVKLLLKKMRYQGHRSEVIQMNSATGKVAQTLLHLTEERLETDSLLLGEIVIPGAIRQNQIAAYAGINRHTVSTELSSLKNAHIISHSGTKRGTKITILDRQRLEAIANEDRTQPDHREQIVAQ